MTRLPEPEFDRFADGYDAGMRDPLKRAFGIDARAFLRPKVEILKRVAAVHFPDEGGKRTHLDFGCGTGDFLSLTKGTFPNWESVGYDVSTAMLNEARRRWPSLHVEGMNAGLPVATFDCATAVCVFHHIPPDERISTLCAIRSALKPRGWLYIFEHNPFNPITRLLVSRATIDESAVLISPGELKRLGIAAGFTSAKTLHFLFMPRWLGPLLKYEWSLRGVPLGGQYVTCFRSPAK